MALTQEDFEKLEAENKKLKEEGAKAAETLAKLKESVEKLEAKNREVIGKEKAAKEAAEKAALEAAKKGGDIEAIEKSWQDKLNKLQEESEAKLNSHLSTIKAITAERTASTLAAELAVEGAKDGLLPHIKNRIAVEIQDGKAIERILDAEGKPSAMTIDDLKAELTSAPHLAPLIAASKASGGGQAGEKGSGGTNTMKDEDFEKLDPSQKSEFVKSGGKII